MVQVYLIMFIVVVVVSIVWVNAIDKMKDEHPEYKGGDFLNWDDDKNHTEDKI